MTNKENENYKGKALDHVRNNKNKLMKLHNHKIWSLYTLRELVEQAQTGMREEYQKGKWRPARPVRYYSWLNDLKLAYLVFTRKADAFIWEDERDYE